MNKWVRWSLFLTSPFNLLAGYAIAVPSSPIGIGLGLPPHATDFYTMLSGALVGLFGLAYFWSGLQAQPPRAVIAIGACGKLSAVLISTTLYLTGSFSGMALIIISGDLLFVGLWFYWLALGEGKH